MAATKFPPDSSYFSLPTEHSELGGLFESGIIRNSRGISRDKPRIFKRYAYVYLLEGNGIYWDPQREVKVSAGSLITVFPEIPHYYGSLKRNWTEIYITFNGPIFNLYRTQKWLDSEHPVMQLDSVPIWYHRFLEVLKPDGLFSRATPLEYLGRLQLLISEIASHRFQKLQPDPDWLVQAKERLQDFSPSNIKTVAKQCGLSHESFRKKFTSLVGQSPIQYRQSHRITRAKAILSHGGYSNKEAARLLHFADEFHFSKTFKASTGFSPRQFRSKP